MGTSKNKTRQTLFPVAIHKPIKEGIELRDGIFVALEDGYIIPATPHTPIEGIAINDVYNKEETKEPSTEGHDRMCIYNPKRRWETFTIDVENGEISQEDVGQTFLIVGELQHINYNTKAENGGQFRLEQVITPTRGEFTYYFDSSLSPQGPKGDDGETPTFTFSPVQTLPVGSDANAIVEKDGNNYDITFQIPAGASGRNGEDGQPGGKGGKGDTVDREIGEVTSGGTAAASVTVASPLIRQLNLTIPRGQDGEDGLSPTPRDEWNSARIYTYLDIVRYPDQDGVGCAWIWNDREHDATSADVPGESDGWMLLVHDGENGEQGEPGGTVVVPVEGRPGKDGAPGAPGTPGKDGDSPHNEGDWSSSQIYTRLAMVRASTGEYDPWGNEIFGYYITQGGVASGQLPPKDNSAWQLLSKDGQAGDGNIWSAMVALQSTKNLSGTFDADGNIDIRSFGYDKYTGNRAMVSSNGINIIKTGHYRVFGHTIVKCNAGIGGNIDPKYINLGRFSILLGTTRSGAAEAKFIATAKQGGPYVSSGSQGPWLDLHIDVQLDLYEGDTLGPVVRMQSDTTAAIGNSGFFMIIGGNDVSGGPQISGFFPTYMGVERISNKLRNESGDKIAGDI